MVLWIFEYTCFISGMPYIAKLIGVGYAFESLLSKGNFPWSKGYPWILVISLFHVICDPCTLFGHMTVM